MKALVTGGGGFLGSAIVRQLAARGDQVIVFARGNYSGQFIGNVQCVQGDITNRSQLIHASEQVDVIFHIAAKAGHWGDWDEYYQANVVGTRNVIEACRINGIPRLINCSSPSVIFDNRPHEGVDESYPYPKVYESPYPATKAQAEKEVTLANCPDLLTVSLRPHLIIGPGDRHLLPTVLSAARSRTLPQVGKGENRVDLSYVEDVANAFLLAADRLLPGSSLAGSIYFLSQDEPVILWKWLAELLEKLELPRVQLTLPLSAARGAAGVLETVHRTFHIKKEPRLTRFLASELALSHWYNISRAKQDLGFQPRYSMDQVLEKLLGDYFSGKK